MHAQPAAAWVSAQTHLPSHPGALRVAGTLTEDARLDIATAPRGTAPHMLMSLMFKPQWGLPYIARVDLGDELSDHMAAEGLLPQLRAGAMVSVAAEALETRMDHGHAALRLVHPHSVVVFTGRMAPTTPHTQAA
jgi:hypothetical protein